MNVFERLDRNGIKISQADIKFIAEKYKIKELSVLLSAMILMSLAI